MQLSAGQVAVVTGGTSGIGFGLAELLVRRGLRVMIADIREDALNAACVALSDQGGDVVGMRTDVGVEADVQALADAVVARLGRVDLVCNNAGIACGLAPIWEQSVETWRWMTEVKLMGVVNGVRAFAPLMIAAGAGHFLNTASAGGLMPLPWMSPYNATMHAVIGLTETVNLELRSVSAALGATVLCPGLVATPLASNSATLAPSGAAALPDDTGGDAAISPASVAEAAIEAVEAGRVHAIVGPEIGQLVRMNAEALLADLD